MELRIKQEQTASKSHQKQIKSLEADIIIESADQKDVKIRPYQRNWIKLQHSDRFAALCGENTELSIEEIVAAMSQVQLKEIQISELHLEIDRLKKVDQSNHKISQL